MDTFVHESFQGLGLSEAMLQDLVKAGYTAPTPIQMQAIPPALAGRDVIGCAQTGTGKTAAFAIPMIERLAALPKGQPQALVLAPTRELALQILATIDKLGRGRRISATVIMGGADMQAQVRGLRQQPDILVATPGRLLDHMWNGTINLAPIKMLVLDEADRMLDMGFAPQINQILDALPVERQTLLFSATLPADLTRLVQVSVHNAVRVMVSPSATTADGVTQALHHTTHDSKASLLVSLLGQEQETVLVFTRTKHRADKLGRVLGQEGHKVAVLHGDRSLSQRRAALDGFKRGTFRILVATDIAARGIDVANIGHVINFDLPNCPEDYVHRIGRTARMKTTGRATSFVTSEDGLQLRAIEQLLGHAVPVAAGSARPSLDPRGQGRPAQRQGRPAQGRPSGFRERRPMSHGTHRPAQPTQGTPGN
ncbi:DEAD/DEAH box helicase [Nitrospira lenta]|uniref:ATP-dependent RNA helicase RhlE n=1 Tax=Nitrospira lenta TaxID=1436998 RepID=A0A330LAQ1_9BACT|nr:DEAD/DEAH box helicase [Nitrospira lenta]SPP66828.1 ATP-dependent RNA helicase RhlE [Nitrospira lenta]